jgi:hypothetical protein
MADPLDAFESSLGCGAGAWSAAGILPTHPIASRPARRCGRHREKARCCPCRKLTLVYIGGAARPELTRPTCHRRSGRRGGSVHPCAVTSVCKLRCNIFDMS